jgi:aspartyl-tRNA(Asn)/glutamyl-tRNA(Gln) amidotransferase subunit B
MYEPVIGLEIHAQLLTKTKLFCGCLTRFGDPPNTHTCPVCLGLPGSLPVLNEEAVAYAIKLALAINAKIHLKSSFARKNYFYPDLPKGYQITQYKEPIATDGFLEIETNGQKKKIGIERINLEEDAGKSIHDGFKDSSEKTYLDFNRCGVPLLEIVGRPEICSPEEAVEFLSLLRTILQYLGICDGNMEEGSLRCDANLSIRRKGEKKFGVKTEIKNLNSFRFLQKALQYEIERQIKIIESGKKVIQETRYWDSNSDRTISMRTKEEAHDYRYFPEPDLPPLIITNEWIEKIKESLPELPSQKINRFVSQYQIPHQDAKILCMNKELANYFEETVKLTKSPKTTSNWILSEVLRYLKEIGGDITQFPVKPKELADLILLIESKKISGKMAKEILPEMISTGKGASEIVKEKGLSQITDKNEIRKIAEKVIMENPKPFEQYKKGKTKIFGFFVGQIMKETQGKANPQLVNKILKELLNQ